MKWTYRWRHVCPITLAFHFRNYWTNSNKINSRGYTEIYWANLTLVQTRPPYCLIYVKWRPHWHRHAVRHCHVTSQVSWDEEMMSMRCAIRNVPDEWERSSFSFKGSVFRKSARSLMTSMDFLSQVGHCHHSMALPQVDGGTASRYGG